MEYFTVKNWERFQHYKDRNPPWIKLHFEILASEDWVMLADASKLLMVVCMMVASRNSGKVPNDPLYLKRVAYLDKPPNLTPLIMCGFLIKPLAYASTAQADARPETETETETETEGVDKKESTPKRARRKISYTQEFENFWKVFPPNGASKDEAQKSYDRAISEGADHGYIERSAGAYAAYLDRTATKTAHATTWINQRRWLTDYGSLEKDNGKSIIATAGKTFHGEAERIAAGFLSQPAGQGETDAGIGPSLRIAEAVRENGSQP